MQEPDGNVHEFEYDASFNLIGAKDKLHEVAFTYGAMGVLRSRTQNGKTIKFDYDKELQLRRIINEGGDQYHFELDGLGQLVKETGFDGIQREYIRDGAGRVTDVYRPYNRWTKYKYDGVGNVIKEEHHDESWTGYKYNAEGLLVEAINEEGNIKFTRDNLGRITKEEHAGNSITRTYNEEGDCIHIGSSLGADIHQEYDEEGNLITLKSAEAWQADWQRDNTGLELYRQMTGGVNIRTERDRLGRESRKTVGVSVQKQSQKQYNWGIGNRLQNIQNELKSTSVNFEYDAFDNLIRADYEDHKDLETVYRVPDAIGNYYQSPSRTDRKYGKSGKLLEDPTYHYHYDAEGNLIYKEFKKHQGYHNQGKEALEKKLKIKFKGSATGWMYEWSANGMLQQVTNPEHGKIHFGYDPLGRRIFKETKKKRTNWLWDGNVPLHEWETHSTESLINVVTWIFESFELCAKITNDEVYSVISDYKKIPYLAINKIGEKVWEQELDIYGRIWTERGYMNFIPMRFAGQYFDIETGLCYNRFRYYDCSTGLYISKDPLEINSRNYNFYSFVKDVNITTDIFGIDWVYVLEDKNGPYYTGRAAENETIQDVANRHSKTKGTKDGARFGKGDKIKRKTSKDTVKDTTRGLEQRGIEERPLLGRQKEKVRGNKINGVSEAKQKGKRAQNMVDADKFLKGKKVSELPTLEELSFDDMGKTPHSH